MAKYIYGGGEEGPTVKRRQEDWIDELQRAADEKAAQVSAEYRAKIANGDYSNASLREYSQKMQGILQEFADKVMTHHSPG